MLNGRIFPLGLFTVCFLVITNHDILSADDGELETLIGVGAGLESVATGAEVAFLLPSRPADLSGEIHVGDIIVAVAEAGVPAVSVVGMSLPEVVDLIRGPSGSEVWVTITPSNNRFVRQKIVRLHRQPLRGEQLIGKSAPMSRLTSLTDDVALDLSSLQGVPVVLDFWSVTCAPCVASIDRFQHFTAEYPQLAKSCRILTVNVDKEKDVAKTFADERGWKNTDNYWARQSVVSSWFAHILPHVVVLDGSGNVVAIGAPEHINLIAKLTRLTTPNSNRHLTK